MASPNIEGTASPRGIVETFLNYKYKPFPGDTALSPMIENRDNFRTTLAKQDLGDLCVTRGLIEELMKDRNTWEAPPHGKDLRFAHMEVNAAIHGRSNGKINPYSSHIGNLVVRTLAFVRNAGITATPIGPGEVVNGLEKGSGGQRAL